MIIIPGVADYVQKALTDGTPIQCHDCGQRVARYKVNINSGMARFLIWLSKESKSNSNTWVDVPVVAPRFVLAGREYSKLQKWGLVEPKPNVDPTKRTSGIWRITEKGILFVNNEISVPSFHRSYNNTVLEWSNNQVSIVGALGEKFDYRQLMT
ncbi:MAG: hypothetical protein Q7S76_03735 [bacterium]|nr:hypothetical protein [bacterium]